MILVAGIDIGFRNTGIVINRLTRKSRWSNEIVHTLISHYNIRTQKQAKKKRMYVADDDILACTELATTLNKILTDHNLKGVFVETPTGASKSARAHRSMGMATGIIATIMALSNIPVRWLMPDDVKQHLFFRSNVSKKEVMKYITGLYPDYKFPQANVRLEHVADAQATIEAAKNSDLWKLIATTIPKVDVLEEEKKETVSEKSQQILRKRRVRRTRSRRRVL